MKLKSSSFDDKAAIPVEHVKDGRNFSPALSWSELPHGTKSLALICEDRDAEGADGHFVHWIFYNLSPRVTFVPSGVSRESSEIMSPSMAQGKNSLGTFSYLGPKPPVGEPPHHYVFTLYALNKKFLAEPGASKKEILELIEGNILDQVSLTGTYERPVATLKKAA